MSLMNPDERRRLEEEVAEARERDGWPCGRCRRNPVAKPGDVCESCSEGSQGWDQ